MTACLDLSRSPADERRAEAAALRERAAAFLGCDAGRLALAASPGEARSALAATGCDRMVDLSAFGPTALDNAPDVAPALIRLGPDSAPLTVIRCSDAAHAERLSERLAEPAGVLIAAGLGALAPAARHQAAVEAKERDALLEAAAARLAAEDAVAAARADAEGLVLQAGGDASELEAALDRLGLALARRGDRFVASVADAETARALAGWLGLDARRTALVRRATKETDIAVRVDLDGEGARVATGVAFFDHMLEQIARHAGIALDVSCEGDVEVDAHHTIEDVCLALGAALREALGDKRGLGRFGFALPMDETRAGVWIDLSGRPYCRFDGAIPGERVGDFPVEMTGHAFRSLAESMQAAIHVEVDGENAHHMIESCFKAFGRALRQAVAVEGDALPSTKGVL